MNNEITINGVTYIRKDKCNCPFMNNKKNENENNDRKYDFTGITKNHNGHILHQIIALKDFGDVKRGDIGGWIEVEDNLSHKDNAWVYDDAMVFGNALVCDNTRVYGNALVYGNARVCGNAWVSENARVHGDALVCEDAWVYGHARVCGNALVYDNAWVYGYAMVCGDAKVCGDAEVRVYDVNC